jgi:phage head maturation protease
MIKLTATAITVDAAASDGSRAGQRVIMGIAAPYGVTASVSSGETVLFEPGSLTAPDRMPRVYMFHDSSQPVGIVTQLDNTSPNELLFSARISATPLGDTALTLSADGVLDVSVGITPQQWTTDDAGTMRITAATIDEISLVPQPAFNAAKITEVYASASIHHNPDEIDNNQENQVDEETPEMEKTPEVAAVEAATPTAPIWAEAPKRFTMPSAAQYMAAYASSPSEFAQINAQIKAAAPFIDTSSTPGILPEIITGSVYDGLNPVRPFVTAIGTRAMPTAGATFRLPKITVRPVVTQQGGENTTLDPSTVTVSNTDVSKLTFGTYVTMSEQDLDWTDPASLNIVLEQLAIAYGQATDNYAVDNCHSAIVQTATVTDTAVGADWVSAIYDGARQISETSNYLPTHMVVTPASWQALSSSVDDQNRPVFPYTGAPNLMGQNAAGNAAANTWNGNPLGLVLVVDKNAPGSFMGHAAGPAAGYHYFEQMKGAISIDVPSSLSRTIAFRGYAAGSMRDATKFVKFV